MLPHFSRFALPLVLLLATSSATQAAQILRAKVGNPTTLYAAGADGKLAPTQRAAVGEFLQVSDTVRNGWRQVVVRTPGAAPRWGWVPERDVQIADEPARVQNTQHTGPSAVASQHEASAGVDPSRDPKTKKNETATLGLKGGLLMGLPASGVVLLPQFGLDFGVRIVGNRSGALFIELDSLISWTSLTTDLGGGVTQSYFGLDSLSRIYLLARNLFGTGLYAGGGAGAQISIATLSSSDGSIASEMAIVPFFAFGAKVGYDIRPIPLFSFGPEVQYNGIIASTGIASSFSFLGDIRFHF